jgi:hypothetical protein
MDEKRRKVRETVYPVYSVTGRETSRGGQLHG